MNEPVLPWIITAICAVAIPVFVALYKLLKALLEIDDENNQP